MAEIRNIAGLDKLAKALHQIPINVALRQMNGPVSRAAALVRNAARAKAAVYRGTVGKNHPPPGTLKKSIAVTRERKASSTELISRFLVTVRSGKKYQKVGKKGINKDAFYWKFVEFGSARNRPSPFMRPAFEQEKEKALRVIIEGIATGVQTEARNSAWGRP